MNGVAMRGVPTDSICASWVTTWSKMRYNSALSPAHEARTTMAA